jgi:hypothetical protein
VAHPTRLLKDTHSEEIDLVILGGGTSSTSLLGPFAEKVVHLLVRCGHDPSKATRDIQEFEPCHHEITATSPRPAPNQTKDDVSSRQGCQLVCRSFLVPLRTGAVLLEEDLEKHA